MDYCHSNSFGGYWRNFGRCTWWPCILVLCLLVTRYYGIVIVALNVFLQLQNVFKKFIFKKFMPDFMTKVLPVVYSLIYTALYGICAIISFVSFAISGVLIYVLFVLCLVDLYFKYRAYKSGSDGDDAESAASGE